MSSAETRPGTPSDGHIAPLQTIVALFKSAWKHGQRPSINDYLPPDRPEFRRDLLAELARVEMKLRLRAGERVRAEEYLQHYPELAEDPDAVRRLVALEPPDRRASPEIPVVPPAGPPEAGPCKVVLEVLGVVEGLYSGARFEFDRHATFVAGRDKKAHLRLVNDPHVARNHCLLEFQPPRCYLRDLGSENGTFVNGIRVEETFLKDGDIISGGGTRLRFHVGTRPPLPADSEAICRACGTSVRLANLPELGESPASQAFLCETCREAVRKEPRPVAGYEVLHPISRGRLARVDLARHEVSGREVALKRFVPAAPVGERALEGFLRDLAALARLSHERLVPLRDFGQADGQFYVATEPVAAADLTQLLLGQSRRGTVRTVCGIVCQALAGLHYIHEQGFVHGGVKPSNLLVCRKDKKLSTRLADCGLRRLCEEAGMTGLIRTGSDRPALPFVAPEVVRDCRSVRPAADIYSAGVTLYFLLAGTPPHVFPLDRDPYAVVLEDEIVPLGKRCPELPPGLMDIVHRALMRKPRQRFTSAAEMFHALLPYTSGRTARR
jgi:serine/threonine-protein kinase